MDYGRYCYEQTKKKQEAKKKQSTFQVKEIKVRPKTGEHDLQTKIGHIKKFIGRRDKVKVTVIFRGREITLSKLGMAVLEKIAGETEEIASVEQPPKFEGRTIRGAFKITPEVHPPLEDFPASGGILKARLITVLNLTVDGGVGRSSEAHAIYI
jgi:translation initiation factor IF-3